DADLSGFYERVTRDDLFDDVHRARLSVRSPTVREGLCCNRALAYARASDTLYRRRRDFARQARFVVIEEPAVFDDRLRDRIQTVSEFCERDLFAATDAFNQSEIRRGQKADVLRVLAVNFLDALRNHQLNAGPLLCIR